ncbi:MAG: tetratricopeptide repeat protein [Desulfobacteraceae bacterium]|jgi:tetratricopeptide (TPR) repeat protein|nr:tetratricopeptide repeat protein [Desulfobacteraceae bacterium]
MTEQFIIKPHTPLSFITKLLLISILFGTGITVYYNSLTTPFLFDDLVFIVRDYAIRMTDLSYEALKTAAIEGLPRQRYLPNISFAFNYYFDQLDPFGYHVVNLAIHLMTAVFLFLFIRLTLRVYPHKTDSLNPDLIAFFTAMLWIAQPVGTQAVTYICQRMASMVAMFYVLSLLFYAKARILTIQYPRRRTATGLCFAGCAASAICAVATKENAGTLPLVILVYEWFFFQNMRVRWSKRQLLWGAFFIFVFAGVVLWYMGENPLHRIFNSYKRRDFTMIERVMTEFRIVVYYISLFLWAPPGRLNLDHDYPLSISLINPPTTVMAFITITGLLALCAYTAKKHRLFSFAILWFFLTQATESTIIGIELIFEHRTYLPFMMVSLMAVMLEHRIFQNRKIAGALLCAVTLIFSAWSFQRNRTWQNPVGFWQDSMQKSPNKHRPHFSLGNAHSDAGHFHEAISEFEKAIQINPDRVDAYNNIGFALIQLGKPLKAIAYFQKALTLNPDHIEARNNLANSLMKLNKIDQAIHHFKFILERQPNYVEANINMGAALAQKGMIDEALSRYRTAIKYDPYNPEAYNNKGVLLAQKKMFSEARSHFQKALSLRPGYTSALTNLRQLERIEK